MNCETFDKCVDLTVNYGCYFVWGCGHLGVSQFGSLQVRRTEVGCGVVEQPVFVGVVDVFLLANYYC